MCREGSKSLQDFGKTLDLRNKPKKSNRQIAQKTVSSKLENTSCARIPNKSDGVMGSLRCTAVPLHLAMPFKIDDRRQFPVSGLGNPHSMCRMRIMLRYCFMELTARRLARVMNPTPIVDRERNTIVMVFISLDPLLWEKDIHENGVYNQTVQMTLSTDLGKTWAEPMDITSSTLGSIKPTAAMFAPGPGHGIQLRSGRLIVPGNVYIKDRR
uniref:Uncharacterized protein LOC102809617 n=1 Tax=Saccoglossus kowalevskii TaxID=10224 RepID=A0ABM0MP49_SACKO